MPNIQCDKTGTGGHPHRSRSWSSTGRRWLAAVTVLLAALGLLITGTSAALATTSAGSSACTRTVTGVHHGALRASSGRLCLNKATQDGAVQVSGSASLQISASTIKGALSVSGKGPVLVCASTLTGAVSASRVAGAVTFGGGSCGDNSGDTGAGPLTISGSAGPVLITGLRQKGAVKLTGNTGGVTVTAASITGATTVSSNKGSKPVVITGSAITGSLACSANKPAPTDSGKSNTVSGKATGQCADLSTGSGGSGGELGGPPPLKQEPPISQDQSSTLPNLNYGEAVGDFTGAGHDERAYAQDGDLKIANADKFGGNVVQSVATDLMATPNDGLEGLNGGGLSTESVWQRSEETYAGATYGLTSVKVAADSSSIYMAGATWGGGDNLATYKLHLYELPHNGSCASASCADRTVDLPSKFSYDGGVFGQSRGNLIVVTSLAVGVVGGQTFIAVGLSDEGIFVFNHALQQVAHIGDMAVPNPGNNSPQTPVTSLAFGPATGFGQGGVLLAGVMSPWEDMFMYRLNADGTEQSMTHAGGSWYTFASAVAQINGQQYAVFGTYPSENTNVIFVMNIDTGVEFTRYTYGGGILVSGLTPLTPWDGNSGNQQLVVGTFGGIQDMVLRYLDGTLTAIPLGAGGAHTGNADQIYQWFPGYGAGRLRVADDTGSAVAVSMAWRPDAGYGCWLNTSVTDGAVPEFPANPTSVAAGQVSPQYFIGALTAGPDGGCASATGTGQWASYVVITPAGDPADQHEVKLQVNPTAGLASIVGITDQAGGDLTATLTQDGSGSGGSWWGGWQLHVTGPGQPAAAKAPAVAGYQLTSMPSSDYQAPTSPVADDPCRPVYRFDVTGAQWTVPGVGSGSGQTSARVAAQIPAMTAQGSTDGGKTWTDLGQLMPATTPTLAGDTVTLGPSSFYWQDPVTAATAPAVAAAPGGSQCPTSGDAPLTDVRVVSGGLPSSAVTVASLNAAAPAVGGGPGAQPINSNAGLAVTPDNPSGTAMPRADGMDQAGLTIQLKPSNGGGIIPASDPQYKLVYYRVNNTNTLVTGLYTAGDYGDYVAVGPYLADGSRVNTQNYLVTTSPAGQSLLGVINDSGQLSPFTSGSIPVAAPDSPLIPTGAAATGIEITGCAGSSTCPLTAPTAATPALYQAGGLATGPVSGLQFAAEAVTGVASLPLQISTSNAHTLASAPLSVQPGQAVLRDTSPFWPRDTIDTALVTRGSLVQAVSIPVGGN